MAKTETQTPQKTMAAGKNVILIGAVLVLVFIGYLALKLMAPSPVKTTKAFFKAMEQKDLEKLVDLTEIDSRGSMRLGMKSLFEKLDKIEFKRLKVTEVTRSEKRASVRVEPDMKVYFKDGSVLEYLYSKGKYTLIDPKGKETDLSSYQTGSQLGVPSDTFSGISLVKTGGKWYISK